MRVLAGCGKVDIGGAMATVDEARIARVLQVLGEGHSGLAAGDRSVVYLTGFYAEMGERFSGLLLSDGERPVIFDNAVPHR